LNLEFEWDAAKRRETLKEREIDFASMTHFEWATALIRSSDRHGESRWAAIGYIGSRLHHVVYTQRRNRCRVISLRVASEEEVQEYAEA
jgi:uncharacterized DUF497 family protein